MKRLLPLLIVAGCVQALAGESLAPNGDFESGFKGWRYPDYAKKPQPGVVVTDTVYAGKQAFRMQVDGDAGNELYTSIKPDTAKPLDIALWVKGENLPEGEAAVRLLPFVGGKPAGWVNLPGKWDGVLAALSGTFDWKEIKIHLPAGAIPADAASCNFYVIRKNNSVGALYIDEVFITQPDADVAAAPVPAPAAAAAKAPAPKTPAPAAPSRASTSAAPVASAPLLDQWQYEKWKNIPEPGGRDPAVVRPGSTASYRMHRDGATGTELVYQGIPFEPGRGLKVTLWLKADGVKDGDVLLRILPFKEGALPWIRRKDTSENARIGDDPGILEKTGGTFDWKPFTITVPAEQIPEGAKKLSFYVQRRDNATGTLYVDGVAAEPHGEPLAKAEEETVPLAGTYVAGRNRWPGDGSFETGTSFFFRGLSKGDAAHGDYALLWPKNARQLTGGYQFRVLKPRTVHTLSVYLKAEAPTTVKAHVADQTYTYIAAGQWEVGTEWKRYVLRLEARPVVGSANLVLDKGTADVDIRVDAIQLNEGPVPLAYSPSEAVSLGMDDTGADGEIVFTSDRPAARRVWVRNNGAATLAGARLAIRNETPTGTATRLFEETVGLAPGETRVVTLPAPSYGRPGYFVTRIELDDGGKVHSAAFPHVVATPPPARVDEPFFGLHPIGPTGIDALGRLGVQATRHIVFWRYTGFQDGNYQVGPGHLRPSREAGMKQLLTLNIDHAPSRIPKPTDDDRAEFVRQYVAAAGPGIPWYDLQNEPDLEYPRLHQGDIAAGAEDYARAAAHLAPVIRAANPGAKVLGLGISGVDFLQHYPFTKAALPVLGPHLDAIAVHPYAHARYLDRDRSDIGPEANGIVERTRELQTLLEERNLSPELWYGEIGWALSVDEDYLGDAARRHAEYVARLMLLSKSLDMKRVLYFASDSVIEKERFYYGIWRQGRPLQAAAAYAVSARQLEGATPGNTVLVGDIQAHTYDTPGGPLAALWTVLDFPVRAQLPLPGAGLEAVDMYGAPAAPLPGGEAGTATFVLSGSPLYLRYAGGDRATLEDALRKAVLDLPPFSIRWRLKRGDEIEVTLVNDRGQAVTGTVEISGATFAEAARAVTVPPGGRVTLPFKADGLLNGKTLSLRAKTNLGEATGEYVCAFLSCPAAAVGAADAKLPAHGRLPTMDGRDWLIPNDPGNGYGGPADLSVDAAVTHDAKHLYLSVNVRDDKHVNSHGPGRLWAADSLQFVLDTRANAEAGVHSFDADDYEFTVALTPRGPEKEIDFIYERGRSAQALGSLGVNVFREGDVTVYRVAIPWKTLKMEPTRGTVFGLNFIANDDDGHGRRFWMGPTPGIGEAKNPYAYKKFIIE